MTDFMEVGELKCCAGEKGNPIKKVRQSKNKFLLCCHHIDKLLIFVNESVNYQNEPITMLVWKIGCTIICAVDETIEGSSFKLIFAWHNITLGPYTVALLLEGKPLRHNPDLLS